MVPPIGSQFFRSFTGSSAASNASIAARASASRLACDLRDGGVRGRFMGNADSWQVTDLVSQAEKDPAVIFTDEAIDEVATQMIGQAYRVEEPDEGQDANAVMQAAENHMMRPPFVSLIHDMMRDRRVQQAAMDHLRESPHFQQLMLASSSSSADLAAPLALEWHPTEPGTDSASQAGLQRLIEDLGAKIMAAGEAALQTAVGMRNALGRFLIHLGASLHAALGKPFSKAPLEESVSEEDMEERAKILGQALTTVAIAILSIVFLKRAHLVAAM